jgi:hypothetical protein
MFNNFFPENRAVYVTMSKNVVQTKGPQMTLQYGTYALHAGLVRLHGRTRGYAVAQLVQALRYKPGRSRVRFSMESLEFFSDLILPVALWPLGRHSL